MAKKIDWSKPVQTTDGRKVYRVDIPKGVRLGGGRTRVFYVESYYKTDAFYTREYYNDGKVYSECTHPDDLVNPVVKKSGWVNVYPKNSISGIASTRPGVGTQDVYSTKKEAQRLATNSVIDTVRIEWEE